MWLYNCYVTSLYLYIYLRNLSFRFRIRSHSEYICMYIQHVYIHIVLTPSAYQFHGCNCDLFSVARESGFKVSTLKVFYAWRHPLIEFKTDACPGTRPGDIALTPGCTDFTQARGGNGFWEWNLGLKKGQTDRKGDRYGKERERERIRKRKRKRKVKAARDERVTLECFPCAFNVVIRSRNIANDNRSGIIIFSYFN